MPTALIVSPIRSWPLDQGNRARVWAMGRMLQERGFAVHFVLSGLEGQPNGDEWQKMTEQWEHFVSVPYRYQRRQRYAEAWGGDDWYDPALDPVIADLGARWSYDLCLVNYAWYSRAFEALPRDVVRIVDTHDAFGDRHKRLYAAGTTPEWYFTRAADEGRCLDRSDFVIAIQHEEAGWFSDLTDSPVRTVGHVTAPTFLPPRPRADGASLRAGYMASGNPSNRDSIRALLAGWVQSPFLRDRVELHLAGPICDALSEVTLPFVVKHGFVADPGSFYAGVDFAVNPNVGGSGLKIKSVEALGYGLPLYATAEGMLGICGTEPPYVSDSVAEMVRHMAADLAARPDLADARHWARQTGAEYRAAQIAAFDGLLRDAAALRAARSAAPGLEAVL